MVRVDEILVRVDLEDGRRRRGCCEVVNWRTGMTRTRMGCGCGWNADEEA